jgi:hypothetical protein
MKNLDDGRSCEMGRLSLPQLQNILHSNFPVDVAEGEVSLIQHVARTLSIEKGRAVQKRES